ncbi:MAG: shikimate dehydrogenase, partial [Flexilinea flocculi]|nr:shikimate dehydrogenase [Flexilinea flocculi]
EFLHQAERQKNERNLFIEDGWPYFIYGWTQVVSDVFHLDIVGDLFKACDKIARDMRK